MDLLQISSEAFVCTLAADTPAAVEVEPGSVLAIRCRNALDPLVGPGPARAESANPGTGPVAVRGAEPGQALRFEILDIQVDSPGYISAGGGNGVQAVPIRETHVDFHGIRIPIDAMIGVLGVAPAQGAWNTMDSGPFGGNMDIRDVAPGATVTIPVFQPGGRFIIGDVHAVMGDGETGGQGLEVSATVTLRVSIEPEPVSDRIHIRRDGCLMTVGWGERIEDAVKDASLEMVKVIVKTGALDAYNAMKFLGLAADTLFGQHCCRIKTVRISLPMRHIPGLLGT